MTVKKLPKWVGHSRGNLVGVRDELKKLHLWTEGYNAAKGGMGLPGTGLLGGPARAIVLINKLLESDVE